MDGPFRVKDDDSYLEECYRKRGAYLSLDAATWSAEEGVFTKDGAVFLAVDLV